MGSLRSWGRRVAPLEGRRGYFRGALPHPTRQRAECHGRPAAPAGHCCFGDLKRKDSVAQASRHMSDSAKAKTDCNTTAGGGLQQPGLPCSAP